MNGPRFFRYFLSSSIVALTLFLSYPLSTVSAATIKEDLDNGCRISIAGFEGVPTIGCLAQVIVNVVQWAYGFSLIAGMAYFIFGGITFMMAQDEKGIKAGRDKMVWALFGFVFIVVSFLLVRVALLLLGFPDLINNFGLFVK